MANFEFNCPQCDNLLSAEEEWRGMETQCPRCSKDIVVPPHITALPNKPKLTPVLLNSDEKPCLLCGKIIKKGAVFCRFCQKNIPMENNNTSNRKSITITERICGTKAAQNGQYNIGMMFLLAGCSFLMPVLGLLYLIAFIILVVTNENHKHDTFMLQYGLLFVISIVEWIFWIQILNL